MTWAQVTRNDVGTSDPDHVGTSDGDARTTKSLGAAHSEAMMDQEVIPRVAEISVA